MTISVLDSAGSPQTVSTIDDLLSRIGSGASPSAETVNAWLKLIYDSVASDESDLLGATNEPVVRPGFVGGINGRLADIAEGTRTPARVVEVVPTLDTAAYASGDLMFNATEAAITHRINAGVTEVRSISVLDENNNRVPMDILLLDNGTSLGTVNGAAAVTGTLGRGLNCAAISIGASAWVNLGSCGSAGFPNVGYTIQGASGQSSVWIAGIIRGAGTYTASGLRIKLGVVHYQ